MKQIYSLGTMNLSLLISGCVLILAAPAYSQQNLIVNADIPNQELTSALYLGEDIPAGITEHWNHEWWVDHNVLDIDEPIHLSFDFDLFPDAELPNQNGTYYLLMRTDTSEAFEAIQVQETIIEGHTLTFKLSELTPGFYTTGWAAVSAGGSSGDVTVWYTYQSGLWSDPLTWTLDGSSAPAYVNPTASIPAVNDAIYVGSGRVLTADLNDRIQDQLQLFGTLDVGTTSGHAFTTISGTGLLRCAGNAGASNLPQGDYTPFSNPMLGGMVEFYGSGLSLNNDIALNKLRINLDAPDNTMILASDLTHNGLLEIVRGTLTFNNAALLSRTLLSNGSVLVESEGKVNVNPAEISHKWTLNADLFNEGGELRLTNRTEPNYNLEDTLGRVILRFASASANQKFVANGLTLLNQLVVNKGTDDTYVLAVSAQNAGDFALYGYAGAGMDQSPYLPEESQSQRNAVAIINGTLEARENIFLPLQIGGGNYNINSTATLKVNGGFAAKGAPDVGNGNDVAIVVYGKIILADGTLNANCSSGITTRDNGVLQVDGGELNTNQLRTSFLGDSNIGGIIMNGGVVRVDGTRPGGVFEDFYTLSLTYPGNLFRMAGGEMYVTGPSEKGLIYINSDPDNTNVIGGTVIAEVSTSGDNIHRLSTRVPFWNLEIARSNTDETNLPVVVTGGSSGNVPFTTTIENLPLRIKNNLTIRGDNSATLQMQAIEPSVPLDLYVQGNMTVENNAVYAHGLNTTIFDGNANGILILPGSQSLDLHHVVINKGVSNRYVEVESGSETALEIQGDLMIENGSFINHAFDVRLRGNIVNRGAVGDSLSTGAFVFDGVDAQQILTSEGGIFHSLTVENPGGVRLLQDEIKIRRNLDLSGGNLFAGDFKVRLQGQHSEIINASDPDYGKVITSGNASAGGLDIYFSDPLQIQVYPLGVEDGQNIKLVPAQIAVNGAFTEPGYIRVVPVDGMLPTADTDAGSDYLDFYWKVDHSNFNSLPLVSHRFTYDAADVVGSEDNFSAGRVLNDLPFTRSIDQLETATDHVVPSEKHIFFNAQDNAQGATLEGAGTTLLSANYTAGIQAMFVGAPQVFFSVSGTVNANWNDPANWNELGQFGPEDNILDYHFGIEGNGQVPGIGDIAFIGFTPSSGKPHVYAGTGASINASEVRFTQMVDPFLNPIPRYNGPDIADLTVLRPTLSITSDVDISGINAISGEGALMLLGNVNLGLTEIGGMLENDNSIIILSPSGETVTDFDFLPAFVPNLFVASGNNGADPSQSRINTDLLVYGDLEIVGAAKLRLPQGAAGDIRVNGSLKLLQEQATTSASEVLYGNLGESRMLDVRGDIIMNGTNSGIRVLEPNDFSPQVAHELILWGGVHQDIASGVGLQLSTGASADFIGLTLRGSGNHNFENAAGPGTQIGKLFVDKGINTLSSFSFDLPVTIYGLTNEVEKPLKLENGILKLNHPNTDIVLSSGGTDFGIPATAGLELNAGTLRIHGEETGLLLDGLLAVSGGLVEIGNAPGNNYLEYSSGGTAEILISGGTLQVGSQIRRGLTNTAGILKYTQTGGDVVTGIFGAPNNNRGVFEILNEGSRFHHNGGSITLVRGNSSQISPSFHIDTPDHQVGGTSTVQIGADNSPEGESLAHIGIKSNAPIRNLTVQNGSGNAPVARLYVSDLQILDLLQVDSGSTLDCGSQNLQIDGDVDNNGDLNVIDGTLSIFHEANKTVSGSGNFNILNLTRAGNAQTNVEVDLDVSNRFLMDAGEMNFGENSLYVAGEARVNGNLHFTGASSGLTLNGILPQLLRRAEPGTSQIDILTIDNPAGVQLLPGAGHIFAIDGQLRLSQGIMDLRGNLLELGPDADIEAVTPFGPSNMISTGGSFTSSGVRKAIPANYTQDVLIPLGLDAYVPVSLIFSEPGFGSGNAESSYLFRVSLPQNGVVVNDLEVAPCPDINDFDNVLQMNFYLGAAGVNPDGLRMRAIFTYDQSYAAVTAPFTEADYVAARIGDNDPVPDIFKFSEGVNPLDHTITMDFDGVDASGISGDYFAGLDCAIPDLIPLYETNNTGGGPVNAGNAGGTYATEVIGGGAPVGAVVRIVGSDVLDFNISNIDFYKTIIDDGATLQIPATSFHRLGIVSGTGTLRLVDSGSLPSGIYNDFFSCEGGKLEFAGTDSYEVLAGIPTVRTLRIAGSGVRTVSNNDISICENLIVEGSTFVNGFGTDVNIEGDVNISGGAIDLDQGNMSVMGNVNQSAGSFSGGSFSKRVVNGQINLSGGTLDVGVNSQIVLKGNFVKTGGELTGGTGSESRFVFQGEAPQFISGDFTGSNAFRRLEILNISGLNLDSHIEVNTELILTSGNIFTSLGSMLRLTSNAASVLPQGGRPTSFIDGPMEWNLNTSGKQVFPVGRNGRFRPLTLADRSADRNWRVTYFDESAVSDTLVTDLTPILPVRSINGVEYWKVNSNTAEPTAAVVHLSWGEGSGVATTPSDYSKQVVLAYDTSNSLWNSYGGTSHVYDAADQVGDVRSINQISITETVMTLGSSDPIDPEPVTFLYFEGETDGVVHTLRWGTAREVNSDYFELERSVDGENYEPIAQIEASTNSITERQYEYADGTAPVGTSYYRLTQVNFDGQRYQALIIVILEKGGTTEGFDFIIYPNPTNTGSARLLVNGIRSQKVVLRMVDVTGRLLYNRNIWIDEQGISEQLVFHYLPGVYIYTLESVDERHTESMVVIR